jgi:hypothetical protein
MQTHRWPEAIGPLTKLLNDQRDFSNDPGYLRGPSWSEFRVARAAAHALEAYETLPTDTITSLLKVARRKSRDPFVACAAISALANKDDDRISDAIDAALESGGLKDAPEYRPLVQAAAWSLFDRALARRPVQLGAAAIHLATEGSAIIAGPLLMAAGILGGKIRETLARNLSTSHRAQRAELLEVTAIIEGTTDGVDLAGRRPILALLAAGTPLQDLPSEDRAQVEAWSRDLDPNRDVQRFTAWAANTVLKLPLSHDVGDLRGLELPERIGILTMRSLSPAREEFAGPDDGT